MNLRGVTYRWNDPARGAERQIGLIAQEVERVLPELVTTDEKGYKSVAYQNVVPVVVEAIKVQQKQMEDLKAENIQLKKELEAIKAVIAELKSQHH